MRLECDQIKPLHSEFYPQSSAEPAAMCDFMSQAVPVALKVVEVAWNLRREPRFCGEMVGLALLFSATTGSVDMRCS